MIYTDKLEIKTRDDWLVISKWVDHQIESTDGELITAILGMQHSDDFLVRLQTKKREQYDRFKPIWFDDAPESAIKKREELKNTDNVEKMEWCRNNISYNADHTMNILSLKKTFCENISWQQKRFTFAEAQELEKSNIWWYEIIDDYRDDHNGDYPTRVDTEDDKKKTGWYKIVDVFSWNNWDTEDGMRFFRDMSWCDDEYRTLTQCKDKEWNNYGNLVYTRTLSERYCKRSFTTIPSWACVCGWKNMAA